MGSCWSEVKHQGHGGTGVLKVHCFWAPVLQLPTSGPSPNHAFFAHHLASAGSEERKLQAPDAALHSRACKDSLGVFRDKQTPRSQEQKDAEKCPRSKVTGREVKSFMLTPGNAHLWFQGLNQGQTRPRQVTLRTPHSQGFYHKSPEPLVLPQHRTLLECCWNTVSLTSVSTNGAKDWLQHYNPECQTLSLLKAINRQPPDGQILVS